MERNLWKVSFPRSSRPQCAYCALMGVIFVTVVVSNLFDFVNSSYAKTYLPLFADVVAEIPDDVMLPSYLDRLEQAYTQDGLAEDGSVLKFSVYREKGVLHLSPNGEEIYPYIEIIKWEPNGLHLIYLSFIDKEGHQQLLIDEQALSNQATDILKKYIPK